MVFKHQFVGGAQIFFAQSLANNCFFGSNTMNLKTTKQRRKTYVYV